MHSTNNLRATALAAIFLCVSALAVADPPAWPSGLVNGIDAMKKLPADAFHVVESQGRVFLMSTNGHYAVVDGKIMDMWNGFEIRSVADAERSLSIPLERMGLGPKELGGVAFGSAGAGQPKPVTVFLDPGSPETNKLLSQLRSLAVQYPFYVVFVPAKAARKPASQALLCSEDAARRFIDTGRISAEPSVSSECGTEKLKRNIVTVQVLGIDTLPFTIASNGRVVAGIPEDFGGFLAANLEVSP